MLDPRVYRTVLVVAALALVVLAFSLESQQGALSPTLAPVAFNGQNVAASMTSIAGHYPNLAPGSDGDAALAVQVGSALRGDGFTVSTDTYSARTVDGTEGLENVIATRPGLRSGSIVIVAGRDAAGAPSPAGLSGTATLLELARVLGGETLNRTIVLASTSGSVGGAGAVRLASTLPAPVDAVIVLGDLAGAGVRQPIVIPWSASPADAPPVLSNTLASAIAAQTALTSVSPGFIDQFAHLALPLTLSDQGPLNAAGIPAVTLSLSGERGPAAGAPVTGPAGLTGIGRAVLAAISALDGSPSIPPPSRYLLLDGKVVPGWAVSLFVLALIIPVAMTAVDGVARARRRGHTLGPGIARILSAAIPFVLALLVVVVARLLGGFSIAPPGPVAPGVIALHGTGVVVLVAAALVLIAAGAGVGLSAARRRTPVRRPDEDPADPLPSGAPARRRRSPAAAPGPRSVAGPAIALPVVMCVAVAAIWAQNPFAAALLIPALHLWLWAMDTDRRLPVAGRLALVAVGLAPVGWVIAYHAQALGFGPVAVLWAAALMVAGHGLGLVAAVEWCVVLGCLVSAATIAVLAAGGSSAEPAEITVRGPITYAGPGSLGGTKSALRR
ncbi:MAG: hypothetical protein ABSH51_03895 [Solirubrobacteraceae bacterium]|jgi:hypothetical protein